MEWAGAPVRCCRRSAIPKALGEEVFVPPPPRPSEPDPGADQVTLDARGKS